jgi:hypothetical protein
MPKSAKNHLRLVPWKFNTFSIFATFAIFAMFAIFATFTASHELRLIRARNDWPPQRIPLALRTGPGTGCRVPFGRGVVALG